MKINKLPDGIEQNLGRWVRLDTSVGGYFGLLKKYSFEMGAVLSPCLVNDFLYTSNKEGRTERFEAYRLEEERPTVVLGQVIGFTPFTEEQVRTLLNLNRGKDLEDKTIVKNPHQLELF